MMSTTAPPYRAPSTRKTRPLAPPPLLLLLIALVAFAEAQPNLDEAQKILEDGVRYGAFPGAVAVVANETHIHFSDSFGRYTNDGEDPPLNNGSNPLVDIHETIFDLASLTKIVATTTSIALLWQEKFLGLDTPVVDVLGQQYGVHGKENITIKNLLTHTAGYPPDPIPNYWSPDFSPNTCTGNPLTHADHFECSGAAFESLLNQTLDTQPGSKYVYSDLSFLTLGYIIGSIAPKALETISWNAKCNATRELSKRMSRGAILNCNFEAFVRARITGPLSAEVGADDGGFQIGFLPPDEERHRAAPTAVPRLEKIGKHVLQGIVNDGNSYALGGIAGHAGVFSCASALVIFARGWMFGHKPLNLNAETRKLFTTVAAPSFSTRALGWNTNGDAFDQGWDHACGTLSKSTFMHIGYTGTQLCCDPSLGIFTILLTNRVYPTDENHLIDGVQRNFTTAVRKAFDSESAASRSESPNKTGRVRVGLEILRDRSFSDLEGNVAVLTNPSGVFPDGLEHIVDVLHGETNDKFRVVGILAPEHGFRGDHQAEHGDRAHYIDNKTGLDVYSIYRQDPSEISEILKELDVRTVLVDIQDVGVRLYTFVWTFYDLLLAIASMDSEINVVVSDRPNPLGGIVTEGPGLNTSCCASRYGKMDIPFRHGLTIGELARLFAAELKTGNENLRVVAMEGYTRGMDWRATALPWIPPSPNLPTAESIIPYLAVVLLEATNAWEGRGTTTPFQAFGAPFLEGNALDVFSGVLNKSPYTCPQRSNTTRCFRESFYNPTFFKYNGTIVPGVQWVRPNQNVSEPAFPAAIQVIKAFQGSTTALEFDGSWFGEPGSRLFDLYSGGPLLRKLLSVSPRISVENTMKHFSKSTQDFVEKRNAYLLY